jgi:hypothetical protein
MYVCIYVCMYVYMYVYMYVCIYVCMHAIVYIYTIQTCMYVCIHVCMCVCVCAYMQLCTCTSMYYVYVHVYMPVCMLCYGLALDYSGSRHFADTGWHLIHTQQNKYKKWKKGIPWSWLGHLKLPCLASDGPGPCLWYIDDDDDDDESPYLYVHTYIRSFVRSLVHCFVCSHKSAALNIAILSAESQFLFSRKEYHYISYQKSLQ